MQYVPLAEAQGSVNAICSVAMAQGSVNAIGSVGCGSRKYECNKFRWLMLMEV